MTTTTNAPPGTWLELVGLLLGLLEAGVPERELAATLRRAARFLEDLAEVRT